MKRLCTILFISMIGISNGQSTKKELTELKIRLDQEIRRTDSIAATLRSLNDELKLNSRNLQLSSISIKHKNDSLRKKLEDILYISNKLKALESLKEWKEKDDFNKLNFYTDYQLRSMGRELSKININLFGVPSSNMDPKLDRKEQISWMNQQIESHRSFVLNNQVDIQSKKNSLKSIDSLHFIFDSIKPILTDAISKAFTKGIEVNKTFDSLEHIFYEKGPKGFPEAHKLVFPQYRYTAKGEILTNETFSWEPPRQSSSTTTPSKDEVHSFVEEEAQFPGGRKALLQYITENLIYPDPVHCSLEGNTALRFVVTKEGEIKDIKVLRKLPGCSECDQEAIRVVQSMPKWIPGKNGGKPVNSYFELPIAFKLP